MNMVHICPALKEMRRRLSQSDTDGVFDITRFENRGRWRASVPENDYTSQPIKYCPYCGEELAKSQYSVDEDE